MRFLVHLLLLITLQLLMSTKIAVASSSSSALSHVVHTFPSPIHFGILEQRYKRFLADVTWIHSGNDVETVHCPNTGSMFKMIAPHNIRPQCVCSVAGDTAKSKRKYQHTLEMIQVGETWVGVNSALANKMTENALRNDLISECIGFQSLRREVEVKTTGEKDVSKIDFELTWIGNDASTRKMLLEVKAVTLQMEEQTAEFPDSVTERGQKHLRCLMSHVQQGGIAGVLFLILRDDCTSFSACDLDPRYGPLLHDAFTAGVQILPYHCRLDPKEGTVTLLGRLPFVDKYINRPFVVPTPKSTKKRGSTAETKKIKGNIKQTASTSSSLKHPLDMCLSDEQDEGGGGGIESGMKKKKY